MGMLTMTCPCRRLESSPRSLFPCLRRSQWLGGFHLGKQHNIFRATSSTNQPGAVVPKTQRRLLLTELSPSFFWSVLV